MIERAFLEALQSYLTTPGLFTPAPKTVGVAEPAKEQDLPAVVLSLANLCRLGSGLGERSTLMVGALRWTVQIDLANAVLPGDPSLHLLSGDRRTLALPHGGLVRADGTTGTPTAVDIQVSVAGQAVALAAGAPGAGEFQADLLLGRLVFGAALPQQGAVVATYFIGQWERRVMRMEGDLNAMVLAADIAEASAVSDSLVEAIVRAPARIAGLASTSVAELGSVAVGDKDAVAARQRFVRFHFQYDFEINAPDSSGGIIREIPVTANLG